MLLLSSVYKTNLITYLNDSSSNNKYFKILEFIDRLIINKDITGLREVSSETFSHDFKDIDFLENEKEKSQFLMFLNVFGKTYSNNIEVKKEAIDELLEIIKINHEDFSLVDFRKYIYSYFEIRLMIILAVSYAEIGSYDISNGILEYLADSDFIRESLNFQKYYIKMLCNISTNYHCLDDNLNALKFSDEGIDYCLKRKTFYLWHILYFRKAITEFLINTHINLNAFKNIENLLSLEDNSNALNNLRNSALEIYGIEF